MTKPDNPQAFPGHRDRRDGQPGTVLEEGMYLRDYFASKIINGICCNQFYLSALLEDFKGISDDKMKAKIAQISYEMADAMLLERMK